MPKKKLIAVFGATGHQGGAVARALARDPNFTVHGITRNVDQAKIAELVTAGVTVLQCDLDSVDNIRMAVRDTDGCFIVTYTDFNEQNCIENEKRRGRNIVDACALEGVPHVLYSTQFHTTKVTGIEVRHLVAKAETEGYIKEKKLPLTSLLVPCYYENFFDHLKPRQVGDRLYVLEVPMGETPLDLVSVDDLGEIARSVFLDKERYLHKTLSVSGAKITLKEIAAELSRHLAPLVVRDRPVTVAEYVDFGQPWSRDFGNMFCFFCRKDQRYNVENTKEIHPSVQSFRDWVRANASKLQQAFTQNQQMEIM